MGIDEKTKAAAWQQIRQYGDPVLMEESRAVEPGEEARLLSGRMIKIMYGADGVGLAAPQIGILQRLIVFRFGSEEPQVLLNPEITWQSEDTATEAEGCLSFASLCVEVERALGIRVRGQDLEGNPAGFELDGLQARILQHEIDHLSGVMIHNRTSREQRKDLMGRLRQVKLPGER